MNYNTKTYSYLICFLLLAISSLNTLAEEPRNKIISNTLALLAGGTAGTIAGAMVGACAHGFSAPGLKGGALLGCLAGWYVGLVSGFCKASEEYRSEQDTVTWIFLTAICSSLVWGVKK